MALRWCILLGLLAVARSQQFLNFTDAADLEDAIDRRYNSTDAINRRQEHLYCQGFFQESTNGFTGGSNVALYPSEIADIWSIYMQFPALSYLDVNRKAALFRLIFRIAGLSDTEARDLVQLDLCQGALEFYAVTEYAESVLARLYFRSTAGLPANLDTPAELNVEFRNNYPTSLLTADFLGRRAIDLLNDTTFGTIYGRGLPPGSNLHPGSTLPNEIDPTFLPIVLGSWGRNVTLEQAEEGDRDMGIIPRNIQNRAGNPNPINYGLEAGDIVFSVIGAILLSGVMALVILGFCIHPFFLA